jgi:hypothetical protein
MQTRSGKVSAGRPQWVRHSSNERRDDSSDHVSHPSELGRITKDYHVPELKKELLEVHGV